MTVHPKLLMDENVSSNDCDDLEGVREFQMEDVKENDFQFPRHALTSWRDDDRVVMARGDDVMVSDSSD